MILMQAMIKELMLSKFKWSFHVIVLHQPAVIFQCHFYISMFIGVIDGIPLTFSRYQIVNFKKIKLIYSPNLYLKQKKSKLATFWLISINVTTFHWLIWDCKQQPHESALVQMALNLEGLSCLSCNGVEISNLVHIQKLQTNRN